MAVPESGSDLSALAGLETEARNPQTDALDTLTTPQLVAVLHRENHSVAQTVDALLPHVAALVDILAERFARGGRLFYVGAGTSGRLGVLDASECPPTFGTFPAQVQGIIAGGNAALTSAIEGAEDDGGAGQRDLAERELTEADVIVGIAASGRTPYVIGALDAARTVGAYTAAVVNVSDSELSRHADLTLAAITGPEPLTGSTRLKAGTAQKMILNLLTTGAMIRSGKVYGNLMVDVRATNAKLRDRAARIVMAACDVSRADADAALAQTDWNCKTAIVALLVPCTPRQARQRLDAAEGWVRRALLLS